MQIHLIILFSFLAILNFSILENS